jgi:DNA repair exonuclease SbcCD ATPase subunit
MATLEGAIAGLGNVGNSLSDTLRKFNQTRIEFKDNINLKIQDISIVIQEINKKINGLEGRLKEVNRLKQQIIDLTAKIIPLQEENAILKTTIQKNEEAIQKLNSEKEFLTQEIRKNQENINRLNSENQQNIANLNSEKEELNAKLNSEKEELNAKLNSEISKNTAAAQTLSNINSIHQTKILEKDGQIKQITEENSAIASENATNIEKIKQLQIQINSHNQYNNQKATEINRIVENLLAQINNIGSVASPDAELTGVLTNLKGQLDGILGNLNTIETSSPSFPVPINKSIAQINSESKIEQIRNAEEEKGVKKDLMKQYITNFSIRIPSVLPTTFDIYNTASSLLQEWSINDKTHIEHILHISNKYKDSFGNDVTIIKPTDENSYNLFKTLYPEYIKYWGLLQLQLRGGKKSKKRKTYKKNKRINKMRRTNKRRKLRGGWTYKGSPSLDSKSSVITESSSKTKSEKTKSGKSKSRSSKIKSNKKHKSKKVIRRYKR